MLNIHSKIFAAFIAIMVPGVQMTMAGEFSSPWQDNPYARVRLIATGYPGAENMSPAPRAGVQIELDPAWKTYWRIPGDSGIPPEFNWDGSKNVKSVEINWPAPHRFIDKYGMSIGYKNEIVLPIKIVPKDITAPVQLALELNYAVCLEICLPVNANMALDIKPGNKSTGPFRRKLQRFANKVPQTLTSAPGLRVRKLDISGSGENMKLSLEVENPNKEALVDVFIEGGDTLFFDTPSNIIDKGAISQVVVPVFGVETAQALKGKKLRFTLVGKKSSVDQYWTIDG